MAGIVSYETCRASEKVPIENVLAIDIAANDSAILPTVYKATVISVVSHIQQKQLHNCG